ncbi:hypothetical protein L085_17915 [Serratia sp. FS14]|nr:hypothetical protein L085_17915 [Serratia sp. FS14]
MQRKKPPTSIQAERRSACRQAAAKKTAGDGEQQQFLRRFGQRGFMHEVMQPVHIDKHQADQCRHEGGGKRECADFPQ